VRATFHFTLPAKVKKKKKWFVSSCPVLDIYSQGETKEKALENLIEAVRLFFISCYERGTLDNALKESGFKAVEIKSSKAEHPSKKYESIDVPIPFHIPNKSGQFTCHA